MRISLLLLLGCLSLLPRVAAQVSVEIALDRDQFLPGESVVVGVRIKNFSGQTLRFGVDNDWLEFSIDRTDGQIVPATSDVPVQGEFEVESSSMATKRVDLAPYFSLTKIGRYRITAMVRLKQWDQSLSSKPGEIEVLPGTVIWEHDFGVPAQAGENKVPEVRKYALQRASHFKQTRLYARVTEQAESRILSCFPLGPAVSFSKPECQIDPQSNLHVLFQDGARTFNYSVVNPDGKLIVRETHEYSDTRPMLAATREGRLGVRGGVRRPSREDLPALVEATPGDASQIKTDSATRKDP